MINCYYIINCYQLLLCFQCLASYVGFGLLSPKAFLPLKIWKVPNWVMNESQMHSLSYHKSRYVLGSSHTLGLVCTFASPLPDVYSYVDIQRPSLGVWIYLTVRNGFVSAELSRSELMGWWMVSSFSSQEKRETGLESSASSKCGDRVSVGVKGCNTVNDQRPC